MNATVLARLANQHAIEPRCATPREVVHALGAVQAQDFAGALWAIALRTTSSTVTDVEAAIARREIVRTWPMRGTLHFVDARDLRWITGLLAPRVIRRAAARHRDLGLDDKIIAKSRKLVEKDLAGKTISRPGMYELFAAHGIEPTGQRGIHILGVLAMQRVICFGAHHGKQPSFALCDDWLPKGPDLDGDEALAELATRYVTSHGPATLADFCWWSGLAQGEARRALAAARIELVDGYASPASRRAPKLGTHVELLPPYDELVVAYKDRSDILDPKLVTATRGGIFSPVVLVDGSIVGTWKRETKKGRVIVRASLATPLTKAKRALDAAVARYGSYLGVPAELVVTGP